MQQGSIDFKRCEQLGMLNRSQLPTVAKVSGMLLKAVLRQVDDHARGNGWCFASARTLAAELHCSEKSVYRALKALLDLELLCTDEGPRAGMRKNAYGTVTSRYQVYWPNLAKLVPSEQNAEDRLDMVSHRLDMVSERLDTVSHKPVLTETKRSPQTPSRTEAAGAGDWKRIEKELLQRGLSLATKATQDATSRGLTASDVEGILAEWDLNRGSFSGPGAILVRIRTGAWPTSAKIQTAGDAERDREHAKQKADASRQRLVFSEIVRAGRKSQLSDEVIRAELLRHLPPSFLMECGWLATAEV